MPDAKPLPRALMLSVAAAQGLALLALYKAFDLHSWPSESPLWSYPLWTIAVAIPVLLLLSLERGNEMRVAAVSGGTAAVLVLLALYTGRQAEPFGEFPVSGMSVVFAVSISIACFKALMYMQQWAARLPMSYQVLFTYSWRNFLTLALAALFVLAFWLTLMLWAGLFSVIGIDVFAELFARDWFLFPVLGIAHGLGIVIFRELTRVIDSITRLLQGLLKLLLPLVVGIAAIFLLALPFTGLEVLWSTGNGTRLLLWLTAIILFFANSVYQDGRGERPYPAVIHGLIYAGMFVLPFLCALSFYGLWLRLAQYGWTIERCWGFVVWLLLTLFSAGYVWEIFKRRRDWPQTLGRVNTIMGLVVMALMLLANSPLLDFRKISLASQLHRIESGAIGLEEFDFYYADRFLARPGHLALEQMKKDIGDGNPGLMARIDNPRPTWMAERADDMEAFWERLLYRPAPFEVPPEVRTIIERSRPGRISGDDVAIRVDLDGDGRQEYLFLSRSETNRVFGQLFYKSGDTWHSRHVSGIRPDRRDVDVAESLRTGRIAPEPPRFDDLRIGNLVIPMP